MIITFLKENIISFDKRNRLAYLNISFLNIKKVYGLSKILKCRV